MFLSGIRPSPSGSWAGKPTSPITASTVTSPPTARIKSPFCGKVSPAIRGRVAILWEGEAGEQRQISYQELHRRVCRFANVLKGRILKAGDRAIIYMGM